MNYNFDEIIDRYATGSYKYDSMPPTKGAVARDVIPMWVADMDFRTAPAITDALQRRVSHGIFGYTHIGNRYYDALTDWFKNRHNYTIDPDSVICTPGVVPAVSAIIKALTEKGDGVIVQTPVYNCFFSSIRNNGCNIVENPLRRVDYTDDGTFSYEMNLSRLEEVAANPRNKVLLLCNPHNPAGRAWTIGELERVACICERNNVIVVSDEIHCDLTMPDCNFVSYARLSEHYANAVICNSPSKAFNTAGLQIANIIAKNEEIRRKIDRAVNDNEVCDVNPFGVEGLIAAYTEGGEWLDALRDYLWSNYAALKDIFDRQLSFLKIARLEATYLVWVDVSPLLEKLRIDADRLEELLLEETGVWVNSGKMYGSDGFIRLNIAIPRSRMIEGLERLVKYIRSHIA